MKKVRVVRFVVQPEAVVDEDGVLTALTIQPVRVDAKDWEHFKATGFDVMLANLEKDLNEREAPAPLVPTHPAVNGKGQVLSRKKGRSV